MAAKESTWKDKNTGLTWHALTAKQMEWEKANKLAVKASQRLPTKFEFLVAFLNGLRKDFLEKAYTFKYHSDPEKNNPRFWSLDEVKDDPGKHFAFVYGTGGVLKVYDSRDLYVVSVEGAVMTPPKSIEETPAYLKKEIATLIEQASEFISKGDSFNASFRYDFLIHLHDPKHPLVPELHKLYKKM